MGRSEGPVGEDVDEQEEEKVEEGEGISWIRENGAGEFIISSESFSASHFIFTSEFCVPMLTTFGVLIVFPLEKYTPPLHFNIRGGRLKGCFFNLWCGLRLLSVQIVSLHLSSYISLRVRSSGVSILSMKGGLTRFLLLESVFRLGLGS